MSSVTAAFAQIHQPSLSLVLLPLQTRAAPALFTPARTRPYPTFSDSTAGNGPSPEAGGHREHATGICEHLLCTDNVQGPGDTAADETEERLGRQEKNRRHGGSPRCVRCGSVSWRKDQGGRGSGVPAQGRGGEPGWPEQPEQVPAWDQGGRGRWHSSESWAPLSLDTWNRGVCLGMNTREGRTSALDQKGRLTLISEPETSRGNKGRHGCD